MSPYYTILIPALSLALFATFEWYAPRRRLTMHRLWRWPNNVFVFIATKIFFRFTFQLAAPAAAFIAEYQHWGLLHWLPCPFWVACIATFLLFDFSNYVLHVAFHRFIWMWRIHRVHHCDPDFDVTTSLRSHPVDLLVTNFSHLALAFIVGLPAVAVIAFQFYSGLIGKFCHSNINVPVAVDRWLRLIMITPDMHRVHHSAWQTETDSNFSAVFPWWDWMFGTYRAQPIAGHDAMTIGLEYSRTQADQRGDRLLLMPFKK